jgi:hypothetical protein
MILCDMEIQSHKISMFIQYSGHVLNHSYKWNGNYIILSCCQNNIQKLWALPLTKLGRPKFQPEKLPEPKAHLFQV